MSQSLPKVAVKHSLKIEVEQGKTYTWCACGLSNKQPFCDGSHSATDIIPITYIANEAKLISFCGCKHSKNAPICDGTHKAIA